MYFYSKNKVYKSINIDILDPVFQLHNDISRLSENWTERKKTIYLYIITIRIEAGIKIGNVNILKLSFLFVFPAFLRAFLWEENLEGKSIKRVTFVLWPGFNLMNEHMRYNLTSPASRFNLGSITMKYFDWRGWKIFIYELYVPPQ